MMNDSDFWNIVDPKNLWVTDKLILAKRLGYLCGPAGVKVPEDGYYVVRPCVNYRMMGRGASIQYLYADEDSIPDGFFWCEPFEGRHLSFDYHYGEQILAVEGFRDENRLDRFSMWRKTRDVYSLPDFLQEIANTSEWFNVEVIGNRIIECHFRFNDDFANHSSNIIIPVWKDRFYDSVAGDRLGFLLEKPVDTTNQVFYNRDMKQIPTVSLEVCDYNKQTKVLSLASEYVGMPSTFFVKSHKTGKEFRFVAVGEYDVLFDEDGWDGEKQVYRPVGVCPSVDHMVIYHQW